MFFRFLKTVNNVKGLARAMAFLVFNQGLLAKANPNAPAHLSHIVYYKPYDSIASLKSRVYDVIENEVCHTYLGYTLNDLFSLDFATFEEIEALVDKITKAKAEVENDGKLKGLFDGLRHPKRPGRQGR